MVKVSRVNSAYCKNWTCILKRREYKINVTEQITDIIGPC